MDEGPSDQRPEVVAWLREHTLPRGWQLQGAKEESDMEGLTVGRMVHYVAYGAPGGEFPAGAHRAAVITRLDSYGIGEFVDRPEVSLCVLNPTGLFFNERIPFDGGTDPKPGTWHWIERA